MKKIIVKEIRYMMSDGLETPTIERVEKTIKLFGKVVYRRKIKHLTTSPR